MANYAMTIYNTVALAEAAIEAMDVSTTPSFLQMNYRDGCVTKSFIIIPDPSNAA